MWWPRGWDGEEEGGGAQREGRYIHIYDWFITQHGKSGKKKTEGED